MGTMGKSIGVVEHRSYAQKLITVLALLALAGGYLVASGAPSALAQDSSGFEYSWNGTNGLDSEKCEKDGEGPRDADDGWIHWVFSTKGASTEASLTLGGTGSGTHSPAAPLNAEVWHFYTPYYEVDGLTASIWLDDEAGSGGGLVISDFCPGDTDPDPEYFVKFAKDWDGDTEGLNLGDDDVTFTIDGTDLDVGDTYEVELGETYSTSETVNADLGDCTSTSSNLDDTYTVPTGDYPDGHTFEIDVTNTINCPEDPQEVIPPSVNSGISLTKTADETDLVDPEVGDEVNYTFTITNDGDDALSETALIDEVYGELAELGDYDEAGFNLDVLDSFDIQDADGVSLAINEELVLEDAYTHTITQDDIDRGGIYNVATVSATGDQSGQNVSATDDELVSIAMTPIPDIAIVKTATEGVNFDDNNDPFVELAEGETTDIEYSYLITNTGEEDLTDLTLVDDKIGNLGDAIEAEVGGGTFAIGDSVAVTAVHSDVTLEDFEDGLLTNVATVGGTGAESGQPVTDSDTESVYDVEVLPIGLPAITVDKSVVSGATLNDDGDWVVELAEGETATIGYQFIVTNPHDEPLVDFTLIDDKIGDLSDALEQAVIDEYEEAVLPGGGEVTVTADYETTAEDFAAGFVTNVVDVTAIGEDTGIPVSDSDEATVGIVEVLAETETREPEDEEEPRVEGRGTADENDVEVKAAVETLPRTGIDGANLLLLGLLFGILGVVALMLSSQRRDGSGPALQA